MSEKNKLIQIRKIPDNAALFVDKVDNIGGIEDDPKVENNLVSAVMQQAYNSDLGDTVYIYAPTQAMLDYLGVLMPEGDVNDSYEVLKDLENPIVVSAPDPIMARRKLDRALKELKHAQHE